MDAANRERWSDRWIFKGTRVRDLPVRLRYRRIYILPTRNGLLFGVMLLVMWLGSVNYNNSMGFALTFLLASLAVVAILHTFRNLLGLTVEPLPAAPVFAGEPAEFALRVSVPGRSGRSAIGLQHDAQLHTLTDIGTDAPGMLTLRLPSERRGWLQPGRCALFTIYPLGLFRAWSWLRLDLRCLVYPRPEADAVPPPPGFDPLGDGGGSGGSEDLAGLRPYRPGDSLRHVHWKTVARGLPPQTKLFAGGGNSRLWLDWDAAAGADTEARLSRLCRWVIDAEAAGARYGLRLPGSEIAPGSGPTHYHRCLSALALYPA
jgi:uncharacterized protein (DUF58 family)